MAGGNRSGLGNVTGGKNRTGKKAKQEEKKSHGVTYGIAIVAPGHEIPGVPMLNAALAWIKLSL
jgi:hypothetical protein